MDDRAGRNLDDPNPPNGFYRRDARTAFLAAYGAPGESALLRALELEKACYEVRYEANYRPDWVWLPLEALERLAA